MLGRNPGAKGARSEEEAGIRHKKCPQKDSNLRTWLRRTVFSDRATTAVR
jgi:hypothetical protein